MELQGSSVLPGVGLLDWRFEETERWLHDVACCGPFLACQEPVQEQHERVWSAGWLCISELRQTNVSTRRYKKKKKKPQRRSLLYACAIFFRDHTGLGLVGFECKSRTIELWVGLRLGDQCLADSSYWLVRLHPVRQWEHGQFEAWGSTHVRCRTYAVSRGPQ